MNKEENEINFKPIIDNDKIGNIDNDIAMRKLDNRKMPNEQNDTIINELPSWSIEPPLEIKRGNE